MNTKPIRKLPELKENQEWACEGGCDVVRPKKFENVFSESYANDGSSINRQSEFYFACQNNHLLEVWCTDKSDSVMLPEEFYQEEASKVVQSNTIEESINLLSNDIDSIKDSFIEESFLTNDDAETLELLITRAIQLGGLFATRDAKPQDVPKGFVLVPKAGAQYFSHDFNGDGFKYHDTLDKAKKEAEANLDWYRDQVADGRHVNDMGEFNELSYGLVIGSAEYSIDHVVTQDDIDKGESKYEVGTEILSLYLSEAQEQSHD